MNFPLFVAKRLFFDNSDSRKVSRPAITIATAGVAIGIAVMIVSVFVVLGFKHTIRNKVIGFGSHIQVTNFMTQMSSDQYPIVMSDSMMSVIRGIAGVKHAERFAYKQGILKTDSDFLGVMLKGVGPEFDSTFIHQNLIAGSIPKFADDAAGNKIVISKNIADKLNIKLGQRVFAYFINNDGVRVRRFTIAGVYQTNLNQYDEVMCFTDLYTAVKLNGWKPDQTSGAEVTVNDFDKVNIVEQQFVKEVNKTTDHYGETYTSQATFIIGRGLLIGNAVGIGFALLQKYLGIVKLNPATYYVSTVPIELNVPALLLINVLTLAVSVFVLIAPSYLISHIHPARSMRYE